MASGNCRCWTGKTVRQELVAMALAHAGTHGGRTQTWDATEAIERAVGDWQYSPESSIKYKIGQYASEMGMGVWRSVKAEIQKELRTRKQNQEWLARYAEVEKELKL